MADNRFSDEKILEITVTVFLAFTMLFLAIKILFY